MGLQPIRLSGDNDVLLEPVIRRGEVHTSDEDVLTAGVVGVHNLCRGEIIYIKISQNRNVLACPRCFLRVVIPESIKTYGDLRRWFGPPG